MVRGTTEFSDMKAKLIFLRLAGIGLVMFAIIGAVNGYFSKKLTGKTTGRLDSVFSEITHKRSQSVDYEVTYEFTANGAQFTGKDQVVSKPSGRECTVFYDPTDPTDNALSKIRIRSSLWTATLILGIVIFVVASGKAK